MVYVAPMSKSKNFKKLNLVNYHTVSYLCVKYPVMVLEQYQNLWTVNFCSRMLGGVHLRMENFQESWLMLQQAGVSGLCEKFHLYRLEKLVAISKFLDSYCSRIMGGGQDNPAGLSSPLGCKINQPGYVAPRG